MRDEPRAKDLRIAPIARRDADRVVEKLHYSHKTVTNSQLSLGVFLGTRLEGAMQFGPSLDRRKLIGLVEGTEWNGFLELNRMAFSDNLPRNSESRAIAVAMRVLRKAYPHVEWVVSFADATMCGDGTIYRAAGFVLTGIRVNKTLWTSPDGAQTISQPGVHTTLSQVAKTFSKVGLTSTATRERERALGLSPELREATYRGGAGMKHYRAAGFRPLEGYQLRYLYFLNPAARERLTVPVLPFSEIKRVGATMYKGQRPGAPAGESSGLVPGSPQETSPCVGRIPVETADVQSAEGGSTPTPTLQL